MLFFRHAQNMAFEKSDLFFIGMLKPLSTEIKVDDHEILAAKVCTFELLQVPFYWTYFI